MKSLTQKRQIEILAKEQDISILEAERRYKAIFNLIYKEMEKKEVDRIVTPIGTFTLSVSNREVKLNGKVYKTNTTKYKFNIAEKLIKKNTKEAEDGV